MMGAHLVLSGEIPRGTASLSVKWTTQITVILFLYYVFFF